MDTTERVIDEPEVQHSDLVIDDYREIDSAMGKSIQDLTANITEGDLRYREKNGRTYHAYKDGKYFLPNDNKERETLDLQHHLFLLTLDGKLHLAPIGDHPQHVLDFGTGTGIWAIEFAKNYPSATVVGTDLSPVQPIYIPPNLAFEIVDAEDEWDFPQPFDYIHGRMMTTCFADISVIFRQAYNSLKPGGWLEIQDLRFPLLSDDDSLKGTALKKWCDLVLEASAKLGRSWNQGSRYRQNLEQCGFVEIMDVRRVWPIGPWPKGKKEKELGFWGRQNTLIGVHGISMAVLTRGLGWTALQVTALCEEIEKDCMNQGIHSYVPIHFMCARKPLSA